MHVFFSLIIFSVFTFLHFVDRHRFQKHVYIFIYIYKYIIISITIILP